MIKEQESKVEKIKKTKKLIFHKYFTTTNLGIAFIVLFLALIFLFLGVNGRYREAEHLRNQIQDIKIDIIKLKWERKNFVDLTYTGSQSIGEIFSIIVEEVKPHLSGIKIKGEILNNSSVICSNIKFRVNFGETFTEQERELFILERINPGYSRDFELYIPDVPLEIRHIEMELISSSISYLKH
jgi:hypothetical protein